MLSFLAFAFAVKKTRQIPNVCKTGKIVDTLDKHLYHKYRNKIGVKNMPLFPSALVTVLRFLVITVLPL